MSLDVIGSGGGAARKGSQRPGSAAASELPGRERQPGMVYYLRPLLLVAAAVVGVGKFLIISTAAGLRRSAPAGSRRPNGAGYESDRHLRSP